MRSVVQGFCKRLSATGALVISSVRGAALAPVSPLCRLVSSYTDEFLYAQGMNSTRKALAYFRVSTDEQARSGLGLDAQRLTVTEAAQYRRWEIVAEYVDEGRSGKTMKRPRLLEALDALDRGEADVLIVAKLDRLSRSVLHFAEITERAKRGGWAVVALDVDVDTTTPSGELLVNVLASMAQWEGRMIGERTKDALQAKKARGARLGRPVIVSLEVRSRIRRERAAGRSLQAVADLLNSEGITTPTGRPWQKSRVAQVVESLALDAEALRLSA